MFARFRQTASSLQVSIVETRRSGGRITQAHVAALGSLPTPPSQADRLAFWTKLHQRLAMLSNRIEPAAQGNVLTAIHARIPMPTMDDQQAVRIERAREDARFWEVVSELHTGDLEATKALIAVLQRKVSEGEPVAADTAAKFLAAKERLARAERGEDVGAIGKNLVPKQMLKALRWTRSDQRHAERLAEIDAIPGAWTDLMDKIVEPRRRAEKLAAQAVLAKHRRKTA